MPFVCLLKVIHSDQYYYSKNIVILVASMPSRGIDIIRIDWLFCLLLPLSVGCAPRDIVSDRDVV